MFPLYDIIPSRKKPIVNYVIIVLCFLAFFYELSLSPVEREIFMRTYGVVPANYAGVPFWEWFTNLSLLIPLITSMFLHGGWAHIIGNMWSLWIFGDNVEDVMGHVRYAIFYLLSGLGAITLHILLNLDSTIPTIGASGAISGVMGAYMYLFPWSRIVTLIPLFFMAYFVEVPAYVYLGIWFIGQLISGMATFAIGHAGGIAFWAHVGGFIAGILLRKVFVKEVPRPPKWNDHYSIEYDSTDRDYYGPFS